MTEDIIKQKNCKAQRLTLFEFLFGWIPWLKPKCEGRACAHWNFSSTMSSIDCERLVAEKNYDVEFTGYCGLSSPVEELGLIPGVNNHTMD
jgi:hypothetical protein